MLKRFCLGLAACVAGGAVAQNSVRPDPADPKATAPTRPYLSAFKDYRPYADPELARWRDVNEEMGRLNGHIGHVRGSMPPPSQAGRAPAPSKPPATAGHGAHK